MKIAASLHGVVRRWHRWAMAAVLAMLAAHSAAWYIVSGRIIAEIPAIRDRAAANGWTLDGGPPERAGWPFAASVRIPHPTASSAALRWTAERIDIAISPLDPAAVHISPAGAQTIKTGRIEANSVANPIEAVKLMLRVPLSGEPPWSLRASRASRAGVPEQNLVARLSPLGVEVTSLTIATGGLLPAPFQGPITLRGAVTVNRPIPLDADLATATAWRAAGGEATLADFDLQWGTLHATSGGRMRLDETLQPLVQAQMRVEGAGALLDTLEQARWVEPSAARAVRAVIALQTLGNVNGAFTLPVRLQDGTLRVMQFPVLRLPPLTWGRPFVASP